MNSELKLFRTLICKNILERRRNAKLLRDYAKYSLSQSKLRNVMNNVKYLTSLTSNIEKLDIEYNYLLLNYLEYKTKELK